MKPTHKLMVANGSYQKDGEEKTRWVQIGTLMSNDERKAIKLDTIPVGNEFDGWVQLFKIEPKEDSGYEKAKAVANNLKKNTDDEINLDDVPF